MIGRVRVESRTTWRELGRPGFSSVAVAVVGARELSRAEKELREQSMYRKSLQARAAGENHSCPARLASIAGSSTAFQSVLSIEERNPFDWRYTPSSERTSARVCETQQQQ